MEDFEVASFEGWPKSETDDDKLKRYQTVINSYKRQIKEHKNTLNYLKKNIYTTLERIYMQSKIEDLINSFPCFTTNLIEAAEFISEYSHDSDDEDSEVILDDSDDDNHSVVSNNSGISTSIPPEILSCEGENSSNCNQENSLNCHQETPTSDENCSQLPEITLNKSPSSETFSNEDDGQNNSSNELSIENTNIPEEIVSIKPGDLNLFENVCLKTDEAGMDKTSQGVMNNVNNKTPVVLLSRLDINQCKERNVTVGTENKTNNTTSKNKLKLKNKCRSSKSASNLAKQYNNLIVNQDLSDTKLNLKSLTEHSVQCSGNGLDSNESPFINALPTKKKQNVKIKVSNQRKHSLKNESNLSNRLFEFNEQFCNLLKNPYNNMGELYSSSILERNFICNYCQRGFLSKNTLRKHILICSKRNDGWCAQPKEKYKRNLLFECKSCKLVYRRKGSLDRHNENIHNLLKLYRCSICRWTFYNNEALHHHCVTRHGLSTVNLFKCAFCGSKFKKHNDLKYHSYLRHKNKQSRVCTVCFKSFKDKILLKKHQLEHGISCEICSVKTDSQEEMDAHVVTHVQEVTYNCGICSRKFHQRNNFKRHIKTHWLER